MKMTLTAGDLREAFRRTNPLSPTAARQKKGERVQLRAEEGGARLTAGGWGDPLRPAYRFSFPARVEESGGFQLENSRDAARLIRGAGSPGDEVEVRLFDGGLRVGDVEVPGTAEPYAPLAPPEPDASIRFDYGGFRDAARRLLPIVSSDESRPPLCRLQIAKVRGGASVRLGATDSFTLTVDRLPLSGGDPEGERGADRHLVKAAVRLGEEGGASLGWAEEEHGRTEIFSVGGWTLWSRFRTWHNGYGYSSPNLDSLLDEHALRGEMALRDPHGAAAALDDMGDARGEGGLLRPVRIWWRSGKMEAAFRGDDGPPRTVGEIEGGGEAFSGFNRDFLSAALRTAPEGSRTARLHFPSAEEGRPFLKPMAIFAGRNTRTLIMPVRLDAA